METTHVFDNILLSNIDVHKQLWHCYIKLHMQFNKNNYERFIILLLNIYYTSHLI